MPPEIVFPQTPPARQGRLRRQVFEIAILAGLFDRIVLQQKEVVAEQEILERQVGNQG